MPPWLPPLPLLPLPLLLPLLPFCHVFCCVLHCVLFVPSPCPFLPRRFDPQEETTDPCDAGLRDACINAFELAEFARE